MIPETKPFEVSKARKASIIRYTALILVLLNTVLTLCGMPVIPLESADIISSALVVIVGLFVGYRNNYLTKRGEKQAEVLAAKDLLKK